MEFLPYLIVCPLVFLAGFIDAIAGGGGLISLPAYMLAGLPPHIAIGTNKLSSAVGTTVATAQYISKGFMVWRLAVPAIVFSLIGANIGSNLTLLVPENAFLIIMLIALPVIAIYVFTHKSLSNPFEPEITTRVWVVVLASAFFIGMYDGFYGPGTGTFLMLFPHRRSPSHHTTGSRHHQGYQPFVQCHVPHRIHYQRNGAPSTRTYCRPLQHCRQLPRCSQLHKEGRCHSSPCHHHRDLNLYHQGDLRIFCQVVVTLLNN